MYEIFSCLFQYTYELYKKITEWIIHFAVTCPLFKTFFSTLHAVHECNITRIVITYKPVFQTRFKRLADSFSLLETQNRRFPASTVTINNVSVITILCGTIIIQLEKENKISQCNNPLMHVPVVISIIV